MHPTIIFCFNLGPSRQRLIGARNIGLHSRTATNSIHCVIRLLRTRVLK